MFSTTRDSFPWVIIPPCFPPSCGFQSVKRQHVSRRSEEEVCETPVSGNNSSSCVRRPSQQATPSVHPAGFAIIYPGIHLSNLVTSSYLLSNSFTVLRSRATFYLERLEWHCPSPLLQPTLEPLGDSPQKRTALRSSEYLSESTSKYALDEQFNGL